MSYGRFVGRVGALAVALGIGIALPVEALADSTEGSSADANTSSANGGSNEQSSTAEPTVGAATTGADSTAEAPPALVGSTDDAEPTATEDAELETAAELEAELEAEADAELESDADAELEAGFDTSADAEGSDGADGGGGAELDDVEADAPPVSNQTDPDRGRGTAFVRADPSPPAVTEVNADAEQVDVPATASSPKLTPEPVSRNSVTSATVVAPSTASQKPVSAAVTPAAPAASTKRTGLLAGLFSLLTPKQSGTGTDAPPAAPLETFVAALQLIRRDFERLLSNKSSTAAPTLSSQSGPAEVTGSIDAASPAPTNIAAVAPQAGSLVAPAVGDSAMPMAMAMSMDSPMAMAMATPEDHQHEAADGEFITLASFGDLGGSDHTGDHELAGGRTPITTEALLAYNNLREFAGLAPTTIDEVGEWAFASGLTNNSQAWGTDQQGVGLYYSMQGAKVGWIADDKYDPQILADIQRTARLGSAEDVMAMVDEFGHDGFADYLTDNDFDETFINTLKMEPHNAGWMHSRAHGRLSIEGVATSHDVNHLTVLSHDQTQPFMNDTFDWPQWPALDVSDSGVIEYFQSMVTLGDPLGSNLNQLNGSPTQGEPNLGGGINSGNEGDMLWGEAHFAPYVDMAGWPVPNLVKIAEDYGVSLLTLGFLQAAPDGNAAWGGYPTLTPGSSDSQAQTIDASIAAFKAAGGDVMISLGGANGTTLAQSYAQRGLSAEALANAYADVVDTYELNRIDFDIEGAAVAEPTSVALRSEAIALLQQARPDLEVWYTLPVLPSGLTHDGLNVVSKALEAGVKLDGVNVMAMDYGESAAPTSGPNAKSMGAYAILAAESTHAQLTSLFAQNGQEFGWNQLGVTPMIGVNDVLSEVFTVADAQALEDFARTNGLGMVSMWSVSRDTPGSLGQATPTASGLDVPAGSFSNVWNDYGTVNEMDLGSTPGGGGTGDGGGPVEGGTTTVIGWNWGSNTVLDFDPSTDKLDFGWFQPANFDVTEEAGSTRIAIVNNDQSYTLDGVALNEMQIGNIVALDTNTVAKWQDLISNAAPTSPLPSLSIADLSVAEGNGAHSHFMFVATLDKASTEPVTVNYATANGTAIAGSDYVATSGTITFAPGATSQTVHVDIVGDTVVEPNETFTVVLSNPTGATITKTSATGTITNDDVAAPVLPSISIADVSKAEGNTGSSDMGFTVSLSAASTTPVTVGYATTPGTATAGTDYTAKTGTITFAPGVTSQVINIPVLGDTVVESNETFTVTLSNAAGATIADGSATGTITNDDVATPAPGASSVVHKVASDWGSGHTASITVTPVQALNGWTLEFDTPAKITNIWNAEIVSSTAGHYVVKNVAWNGVVGAGKSVEFGYQATPGGAASPVTNFKINGVAVGAPGPAPTLPSVSVGDAVKAEGDSGTSNLGLTVSLSEASNNPVTVGYSTSPGTATAGSDYVAKTGTVSFAPGVTSQVVNIGVVGDTVVEQNETFTITLSNAAGATIADGTAVGTITNDDVAAPQLPSVSIGNAVGAEGDSGTSNLGFTISLSEASNDAVTVDYATVNGTATAGADYTAKAGTVTFNPGVTSQLVNVSVVGDTTVESNGTFTITLSNAAGATISDGPATGTITNDDSDSQPGGPSVPFGSHSQDYAPGTIVPTGSQATLDAAVVALYNTWKSNFLVSAGDGQLAVRSDDADHPYVGEAQGYGLQLTALMAGADPSAQESFDGLLKYVLAHPSSINPDLHAAEQNDDFVSVNGGDSATDADLSIAYALLLADQQWGSEGTYDYEQLAVTRINAIKASEMDPNTFLPTLGDWNTPDGSYGNSTRPSDFMIDHFRAFEVATGDPFWGSAVAAAQDLVTQQQNDYAPTTGLIADFVVNTNSNPKPAPTGFVICHDDGTTGWPVTMDHLVGSLGMIGGRRAGVNCRASDGAGRTGLR